MTEEVGVNVDELDSSEDSILLAIQVAKRQRKTALYQDTDWVPPTSNTVERFFSRVNTWVPHRSQLLPVNLEAQLFLCCSFDLYYLGGALQSFHFIPHHLIHLGIILFYT